MQSIDVGSHRGTASASARSRNRSCKPRALTTSTRQPSVAPRSMISSPWSMRLRPASKSTIRSMSLSFLHRHGQPNRTPAHCARRESSLAREFGPDAFEAHRELVSPPGSSVQRYASLGSAASLGAPAACLLDLLHAWFAVIVVNAASAGRSFDPACRECVALAADARAGVAFVAQRDAGHRRPDGSGSLVAADDRLRR